MKLLEMFAELSPAGKSPARVVKSGLPLSGRHGATSSSLILSGLQPGLCQKFPLTQGSRREKLKV